MLPHLPLLQEKHSILFFNLSYYEPHPPSPPNSHQGSGTPEHVGSGDINGGTTHPKISAELTCLWGTPLSSAIAP